MPSEMDQSALDGDMRGDEKDRPGYGFISKIANSSHFERITERIRQKGYFTDRVISDLVSVRLSDIALILSPTGELAYAAHVRPAKIGTTGTKGFKGESPVELNITEYELELALPSQIWDQLRGAFVSLSPRPKLSVWEELWSAIKKLRPHQVAELQRLEQLRFDATFDFEGNPKAAQDFFEKDAIGVALATAGIPYSGVFAGVAEGLSNGQSLLQSLCGNTTEDVLISHDVRNFPGYLQEADVAHAVELSRGTSNLTIFNVNRRPAEHVLGVDLIYHNKKFNSFTFVQYKMFEPAGRQPNIRWTFRPDSQFRDELARIQRTEKLLGPGNAQTAPDYRLSSDAFFFKFCKRQHLKLNAGMLAHGHYLTSAHTELVLNSNKGPRGGTVIDFGSMERWLTRTAFASLLDSGWIGTSGLSDLLLQQYIAQELDQRKSILLAVGNHESETDETDE